MSLKPPIDPTSSLETIIDSDRLDALEAISAEARLDLLEAEHINVKDPAYGAVGDGVTNDTAAIQAAWAAAVLASAPLFFPAGNYNCATSPSLSLSVAGSMVILGSGVSRTTITLPSGGRLIDSAQPFDSFHMADLTFSGGAGAFRCTFTTGNVNNNKVVERVYFGLYTGCAWESRCSDEPYWIFRDCRFRALNHTATIGIALGGAYAATNYLDHGVIDQCQFNLNRYHLKLPAANNFQIKNSDFVQFAGTSPGDRAHIWMVPDTDSSNSGSGLLVSGCKFGNENAQAGDKIILYADDDSATGADWGTRMAKLSVDSAGFIVGHTFRDNAYFAAAATRSVVYSTTPSVRACSYSGHLDGVLFTYMMEFRNAAPVGSEFNESMTFGPFTNDVIGISQVAPLVSNVPGVGNVIDLAGQWSVTPRATQNFRGGSDTGDYVRLVTTLINSFTLAGGATKAAVTDANGGQDAAEVAFTALNGTDTVSTTLAGGTIDRPLWLEFDLKSAVTNPITDVLVRMRRAGVATYFSRRLTITSDWVPHRFYLRGLKDVTSVALQFFPTGSTGGIQVGRVRCYQAREPVARELIPAMPVVASATTIVLPSEGSAFSLTGTTTVDHIAKSYTGRAVLLNTTGALTLTHNAGSVPSGYAAVLLNAAANFASTANDVIGLLYNGTNWLECAPGSVN